METSSYKEMFSVLPDKAVQVWPPSCSAKHVRRREAERARIIGQLELQIAIVESFCSSEEG